MTRGVKLGGREEALVFSVNSACMLEEITGQSLSVVLSKDISGLRALLWCGLLRAHPGLTLEQAGDMLDEYLLDGGDMDALCELLADALEDAGFFQRAKRTT